ncbi:MAG: hypothetical protein FWC27_03755 [Firmicutes bacterium]|nr:hypothetical protein [Bacillota bacterium]
MRNCPRRFCALCLSAAILLCFTGAALEKPRPLVIAHRGANAYAPENTLPAFRKAAELGADGAENDILLTKDGVVVISHDDTIDRCSDGTGRVDELTFAQLREYDFGSWFSPEFAGTQIPTLDEFLDVVAGMEFILIELKTNDRDIAAQAVAAVSARGLLGKTVFQSFDMDAIRACKAADPAAKIALLYGSGDYDRQIRTDPAAFIAAHRLDALHPQYNVVTSKLVRACEKAGVPVRAWTVNERNRISAVIGQGVRGIISDEIELCQTALQSPAIVHWFMAVIGDIQNAFRQGTDIFPYRPDAAAWLQAGLNNGDPNVRNGYALLYYLLWPGAQAARLLYGLINNYCPLFSQAASLSA